MTARAFACGLLSLVAGACGASTAERSHDPNAPVVEIPNVSAAQASAAEDDPPPPEAQRQASAPAAPQVDDEDLGSLDETIWSGGGVAAGPSGGPDCDRAADCCLKFAQNSAPPPSLVSICDGVRRAPSGACGQYLMSFQQVATQMGIICK